MDAKIDILTEQNPASKSKRWLKILRPVIAIAVAIALAVTIYKSAGKLQDQEFDFTKLEWHYLLFAMFAYSVAMLFSAIVWRIFLVAMGGRPGWLAAIRAFIVSQLGKYIPGKAMVVVIRTDMIRDKDNDTVTAVASVFAETLTWIFVGSVIACVLIFTEFREQTALKWTAGTLAILGGLVTLPPVFRFLAARIAKRDLSAFSGLRFSTLAIGWLLLAAGWAMNGLSLWLVLHSFPEIELGLAEYRLALACVSLATVAGFVSLLPGGLGVRELVVIPLLGPQFGMGIAVVAAILIRLVWLFAELACTAIIYPLGRNARE